MQWREQLLQKVDGAVERRVARMELSQEERIAELTQQRARARERARDKEVDAKLSKKRLHRAKVYPCP